MLALGVLATSAVTAGAGQGVTWRREYVRQWEIAAVERALGKQAADQYRVEKKIVGGTKALPGTWPFQVALLDSAVRRNYDALFCGGALVNKLFVVTAAHCVYGARASEIHVLTGTQSLIRGGTRRAVAAIRIHPSYNDTTSDYDIAVIKLRTAATGLALAKLISAGQEPTFAAVGKNAIAAGWGNTSATGSSFPADLRQVTLPLVSRTNCNDGNSYDGAITTRMICAGFTAGGKDSCDGDSGGPLVVKDSLGRWNLQAGIVSWGDGCAQRNLYGVYARVAVLSAWAKSAIAALSPQPPLFELIGAERPLAVFLPAEKIPAAHKKP
jgi:trypsin